MVFLQDFGQIDTGRTDIINYCPANLRERWVSKHLLVQTNDNQFKIVKTSENSEKLYTTDLNIGLLMEQLITLSTFPQMRFPVIGF